MGGLNQYANQNQYQYEHIDFNQYTTLRAVQQYGMLVDQCKTITGFAGVVSSAAGSAVRFRADDKTNFLRILKPEVTLAPTGTSTYVIESSAEIASCALMTALNQGGWSCNLLTTQIRGKRQNLRVSAATAPKTRGGSCRHENAVYHHH